MAISKRKKAKSIAKGRPPLLKASVTTLSAKATRTLIRSHHNLHKRYSVALARGDYESANRIEKQIQDDGGIKKYQQASTVGQSVSRGGDSSKILVEWLEPIFEKGDSSYRVLEVGALSIQNAIAQVPKIEIDRIDLHSQHADIREIDFMDLAIPLQPEEKYDIISLSLVLNYVPTAEGRGDMLRHSTHFSKAARRRRCVRSLYFVAMHLHCPNRCHA